MPNGVSNELDVKFGKIKFLLSFDFLLVWLANTKKWKITEGYGSLINSNYTIRYNI